MIERHQDYQLNIASLPAGGLKGVELRLDSDAAFACRWVKQRFTPNVEVPQKWSYRFVCPSGGYNSDTFQNDTFGRGTLTRGYPKYPQMVYPADGAIVVDLQNDLGTTQTNVKLLFRGSKLYPDGSIPAPTYPDVCSILPNVIPVQVLNIPQNTGAGVLNNQINVPLDWDFALRYVNADPFALAGTGTYDQLYAQLKDKDQKPFSNVPIHIDDLFGSQSTIATGSVTTNPFWPGVLTPEIYIPANGILFFDLFRSDTSGGNVTMQFSFGEQGCIGDDTLRPARCGETRGVRWRGSVMFRSFNDMIQNWKFQMVTSCGGGLLWADNFTHGHSVFWIVPTFPAAALVVVKFLSQSCSRRRIVYADATPAGGKG